MENSTKALLIAAGVLIVIVIIALAIRLLRVNDDSAQSTGEFVETKTSDASSSAVSEIKAIFGYKNLISASTDKNGNIFNGTGYRNGYRFNSSGEEQTSGISTVSGFIKYKVGDIIYTKGDTHGNAAASLYIYVYDENPTIVTYKSESGNTHTGLRQISDHNDRVECGVEKI